MIRMSGAAMALALALSGPTPARAETIVAKRIAQLNHLVELEKITVGPDDQYHGAVSPDGKTLVFTHKADLVPHLERQDLESGDVSDLLPLSADSEEPTVSPDGLVGFTYYKFNARGDVCWINLPEKAGPKPLEDSAIHCLKRGAADADTERSNPFWVGPRELGYVVRDISSQTTRIIAENLDTGVARTLADGRVWSPAMTPGGRYLFFNELISDGGGSVGSRRALIMKNLVTGATRELRFTLPGLSGFPAVSDDEKYLYFSHYLNDTNGDNVIDGADNSVVFRLPIADMMAAPTDAEVFPEQLTSVESNCSFPRPFGPQLYVTCAFEGALDIYRLPASGIVPAGWGEELLANAHETSRSYQERILLLNTMKYRLKQGGSDFDERLMALHILSDDTAAARYYIGRLSDELGGGSATQRKYYQILNVYLEARELKKSQPSPQEVTPEFRDQIGKYDDRVARIAGGAALESFQRTVRGLLQTFVNRPRAAIPFLHASHQAAEGRALRPLERYLQFELAVIALPPVRGEWLPADLVVAYRDMMLAPEQSEEEHIYYAFELLARIKDAVARADALRSAASKPAEDTPARERIQLIQKALTKGVQGPVATLLQSEVDVLRLIESPDDASKASIYEGLDKLMSATKSDYFLRKALYVRAILNFADAAEFKYLEFVAGDWLKYTQNSDTEFLYARDVYAGADVANGYSAFAKGRYQLASSYFFSSLNLTDDLESHDGYVRSMVLFGQRKQLDPGYVLLQKRGVIDDNMKYVTALLTLIDASGPLARERRDTGPFDEAIGLLESMSQEHTSPLRYLLLGYCQMEKLRRKADGYVFDEELFQQANRNLMLAYDLGRGDERIKAAALVDLGLLHQRAQNHGLATRYLTLREKLGFVSESEETGFRYLFAQSLYYDHQPEQAASQIALALQHAPSLQGAAQAPLKERRAFYLMSAARYPEAQALYAELLSGGLIPGDRNQARAWMSEGFCMLKLGHDSDAQRAFHASLDAAAKLERVKKGGDRLVDFEPVRIQLIDYGLLARVGTVGERSVALEKRADLLPEAKGLLDGWEADVVQNRLQLASYYGHQSTQQARAQKLLDEAISAAKDFGDADQYLGATTFRPAVDDIVYGIEHPDLAAHGDFRTLKKVVEGCLAAYGAQKQAQPVLDYQELKLRLLWSVYLRETSHEGAQDIDALFASEIAKRFQDSGSPAQLHELERLRTAVAGAPARSSGTPPGAH